MQVLKFGGSSVANADNMSKVVEIVQQAMNNDKTIVVLSALGGITDLLLKAVETATSNDEKYHDIVKEIEKRHFDAIKSFIPVTNQSGILSEVKKLCNEIEDICNGVFLLQELSAQSKDKIASYGEILSTKIFAAKLQTLNIAAEWIDSRTLIKTNSNFGKADVLFDITNKIIQQYINQSKSKLFVAPGFVASDKNNIITTLGRGGSDYTASIFAAATDATALYIWTDVNGILTADPNVVSNAKLISEISYQEAMELSHFGAKVIYPPTIHPVMRKNIPIWIKNTFHPNDSGTVIKKANQSNEKDVISGISSMNNIALINLEGSGMVGVAGFSKRLFSTLAMGNINVIIITQSSSEHSICVGIEKSMAEKAKTLLDETFEIEISTGKIDPIEIETGLSIIALVGDNMKNHTGVSGKMFDALGRNGINIRAIAQGSSEKNITAVISEKNIKKALNVLHEEFFETTIRQVNIFLAGVGNVGGKLLNQIHQQKDFLIKNMRLQFNVIGLANSKKFYINDDGIDLADWQTILQKGTTSSIKEFTEAIIAKNLRNSIFVDVTANADVAAVYESLLTKSISVVACNKIAASSAYENYKKLKHLAKEFNCKYLFETNVGAALPILGTLNDLVSSGDRINKIQAVLSGTLNFVFNNYDATKTFSQVVKQAQIEGYTEPDPRLDLGGVDVMRKIMILIREAGNKIELNDIKKNGFLPESCMQGTVDDFYKTMEKEEAHFKKLYEDAHKNNTKLKFVATYDNGKAEVGLQHIDSQHDLYNLYGKDNIVLFYTERYPENPLVVKGAGAGADVTASGVFADILRAVKD